LFAERIITEILEHVPGHHVVPTILRDAEAGRVLWHELRRMKARIARAHLFLETGASRPAKKHLC